MMMEVSREILEVLKKELESLYANLRFKNGQYNRLKTGNKLVLVQLNVFQLDAHGLTGSGAIWNHIFNLDLDGDLIKVSPSVYGPRTPLPSAFDLRDPNSIEMLCSMLDDCGGERNEHNG